MSNRSDSIDLARRVIETLPPSTSLLNPNCPSFRIMKLPTPDGNVNRLQSLVVEYCIQPYGAEQRQAIWWTSYVVLARRGTLTRGSGVYTEWSEFGTVSSHPAIGIIAPRTSGISIVDISKGVLNGPRSYGTILRVVDLNGIQSDVEIFAVLVTSPMYDAAYHVHGQATLEYEI